MCITVLHATLAETGHAFSLPPFTAIITSLVIPRNAYLRIVDTRGSKTLCELREVTNVDHLKFEEMMDNAAVSEELNLNMGAEEIVEAHESIYLLEPMKIRCARRLAWKCM
jgi:hypothetical protein